MGQKGFTLVELLIVILIIGLLATIAIPKLANTKKKAYLASMKSDLRNLVTAEEGFFADSVKYSTNVGTNPGQVLWQTSQGNVLTTLDAAVPGWTAEISNPNTTAHCYVYLARTPVAPATVEGAPACK